MMKCNFAKTVAQCFAMLMLISICESVPAFAKERWQIKPPNTEKIASAYKNLLAQVEEQTAGLEIQISAPDSDQGRVIRLDQSRPCMGVVIRNTSCKTINLFSEENSWGFYNLHLEVLAVDGRPLSEPLVINKGSQMWFGNTPSTEQLAPHETVVRDVWLHLPAARTSPEKGFEKRNEEFNPVGNEYWFFPFPPKFQTSVIVMKAVFKVAPDWASENVDAWTGRVSSAPFEYKVRWGTKRP